ncbi:MAG: acetylornithine deacetylase [Gammaproteobacteria bacterium]|nr:acetylornithine deacetylase [Gammaproteobacteria bacterium]
MKSPQTYIDTLRELIAFDTTSRNSNLQLIDYIQSILSDRGVTSELTYDEARGKANLFATIGRGNEPGIILSGHTDVVPVDGQSWSTEPFGATIKEGRLFGRGACDMKGFIAVCLAKVDDFLSADLNTPIHFAFSYDEEVGCVGVKGLLEELKKKPIQPRACIIGEPTSMGVIRAHKGMLFKRCHVHGKSAHSSLVDQGVNAITMAAKTIAHIDSIAQRIQREGPFDQEFAPPYTTLHCGVIKGGIVNNIIPNECQFDFEIRNLPDHSPLAIFDEIDRYVKKELLPKMHEVSTDTGFEWKILADYPGLNTPLDDNMISVASNLLQTTNRPGKVSYGTEGGHFQSAGFSTIVCGPGSIEQAHKPDEYVGLDQLAKCDQFLSALIQSMD